MHEYSIVSALMDQVEAAARERRATAVHSIRVRIGDLAGVEPELFQSAFELCRERTICSRARLEVASAPAVWNCTGCGAAIAPGEILRCPACGLPARLSGGDEIVLERIEMEVPDAPALETGSPRPAESVPEDNQPGMEASDV